MMEYESRTFDQDAGRGFISQRGLIISVELVAYVVLLLLTLVLRVAELDAVPLTGQEAEQALAAWRAVVPGAAGDTILPESGLLFAVQSVAFAVFGATELSARLVSALAGLVLVFTPLLFRDWLGTARTYVLSLLLALSPVLLASARLDTPALWAVLGVVLALWALRRYVETPQPAYALLAASLAAAVILLADPAGFVLVLIVGGAGIISLMWGRGLPLDPTPVLQARLRGWPWLWSLAAAALTVILVSTLFMLYLPGLAVVSETIGRGLAGLVTPVHPNALVFFPLVTALFYEPFLWVFALTAVVLIIRRGDMHPLTQFFVAWLVLAVVASLIYRGAGPEHALWLILPLAGLASGTVVDLLQDDRHPYFAVPMTAKLILSVSAVALLVILTVNLQAIARAFLRVPDGALEFAQINPLNAIWAGVALVFLVIGFFLASSLWGQRTALRGGALGVLVFGVVTSLGSGWSVSVTNADNPVELWHVEATGQDTRVLRDTLLELALRESGGFNQLPLYVQADDAGVLAWMLRDFHETVFINDPGAARQQGIALLQPQLEPPDLGGHYVGQDFIITRVWNPRSMIGLDMFAWWMQRMARIEPLPVEQIVLWLRQDIYEGVPFNQ